MNSRKKQILILFTVWAGLLVAVLYSPIGSPELYSPAGRYPVGGGVNFANSGAVNDAHFPTTSTSSGAHFTTQSGSLVGINNSYSVAGLNSDKRSGNGSYGGGGDGVYARKTGSRSESSSGSMLGVSGGFSQKSSTSGTDGTTAGIGGATSLGTDLIAANNQPNSRQGVTQGTNDTSDPGGDGGTQIPIGDGWYFLLVLLGIYVVWKRIKLF